MTQPTSPLAFDALLQEVREYTQHHLKCDLVSRFSRVIGNGIVSLSAAERAALSCTCGLDTKVRQLADALQDSEQWRVKWANAADAMEDRAEAAEARLADLAASHVSDADKEQALDHAREAGGLGYGGAWAQKHSDDEMAKARSLLKLPDRPSGSHAQRLIDEGSAPTAPGDQGAGESTTTEETE